MDGFVDGAPYPYLTDPYEAPKAIAAAAARTERAEALHGPFVPACTGQHLGDTPTARLEREQLSMLVNVLVADWEGAMVCSSSTSSVAVVRVMCVEAAQCLFVAVCEHHLEFCLPPWLQ
jgi:hypothetical protein